MIQKNLFLIFLYSIIWVACNPIEHSVVDIEGNSYPIKEYHGKIWMTENLKVKKDTSGETITYYFPNDNSANIDKYGLLYDYETACKVCPKGWRIPNNDDWEELFQFKENNQATHFKANEFWVGENNSNQSGFSIRPSGYGNNGTFDNHFKEKTIFWSKTKENEHDVWTYVIEKNQPMIRKAPQHPTYGFSIRCVKQKI